MDVLPSSEFVRVMCVIADTTPELLLDYIASLDEVTRAAYLRLAIRTIIDIREDLAKLLLCLLVCSIL